MSEANAEKTKSNKGLRPGVQSILNLTSAIKDLDTIQTKEYYDSIRKKFDLENKN
jgi:hypothetical protein